MHHPDAGVLGEFLAQAILVGGACNQYSLRFVSRFVEKLTTWHS